jgi:hypothetical protein
MTRKRKQKKITNIPETIIEENNSNDDLLINDNDLEDEESDEVNTENNEIQHIENIEPQNDTHNEIQHIESQSVEHNEPQNVEHTEKQNIENNENKNIIMEDSNMSIEYLELKNDYKILFEMHNEMIDKYENIKREIVEIRETLDKIMNDRKQNMIKMISNLAIPEEKREPKKEEINKEVIVETKTILPKKEPLNKDMIKIRRRNNF